MNKEIFSIGSLGLQICEFKKISKPIILSLATFDNKNFNLRLAIVFAHFFSLENKKILIIDNLKSQKNLFYFFDKQSKKIVKDIFKNYHNLSYLNANNFEDKSNHKHNYSDYDVVIKIIYKIGIDPMSIKEILSSDYFILSAISNKTNKNDILRFKNAIGQSINKCISGIFISK